MGTRHAFVLTLTLLTGSTTPSVGLGQGNRLLQTRIDGSRMSQLHQILRFDSDEKKRRAAVVELGRVDPRAHPEAIQSLIAVVQKDTSAQTRIAAIEVLVGFNEVFPTAGLALEQAAESDRSSAVRTAAKQALWEYHLKGYRSAKGIDGFAEQTAEPPVARRARRSVPLTSEPPLMPVVATVPRPAPTATLPPVAALPVSSLPPGTPYQASYGPRVGLVPDSPASAMKPSRMPPVANATAEPPLAKRTRYVVSIPAIAEPPLHAPQPEPSKAVQPPRLAFELPPLVPPPPGP
jgi:hypothetical protein